MKNKGFTLIEILIVVSVMMLAMVSISGIMSSVFTSQNKNKTIDGITQNGNWILGELKKNVLNANSRTQFVCNGNSIQFASVKDGERTVITCIDSGNIASHSIERDITIDLINEKDITLSDCENFITCTILPSGQLSKVNFNFTLGVGLSGYKTDTSKTFSADVTLRN